MTRLARRPAAAAASPALRATPARGSDRPRGYDPAGTRAALLQSALTLFESKGFHDTSVQEVTALAGVTKGAFYHHFQSKEDLLRQVHAQFVDEQVEIVEAVFANFQTARARLGELIRQSVLSVERHHDNVAVFYQERRFLESTPEFADIKVKRDFLEQSVVDVIRQGVRDGEFNAGLDERVCALGIFGMAAWTYQWFKKGRRLTAEQVATQFASMVLDGLAAPGSAAPPRSRAAGKSVRATR